MKHEQLLTDVFKAYYDARKHKRNTTSQLKFEVNMEDNLVKLAHDIESANMKWSAASALSLPNL